MTWTYSCPLCGNIINPDETVILVANRGDSTILLGLHPQPGNYTMYIPPGCDLRMGDRWDFYCPVCRENLLSEEHENLCTLTIWQGDARRKLLFSRVFGERATYVVADKNLENSYGEHSKNYENTVPRYHLRNP